MRSETLIGLLGGSFDPFHNGHLALAQAAVSAFSFDRLLLMPVGLPPHKSRRLSFSTFRVETARLATENLPRVWVSEREILTPGRNYTVDTIETLLAEYPGIKIKLISGSDFLFTAEEWYRYDKIMSLVSFAIALRGDADKAASQRQADYMRREYKAEIDFFPMQTSNVSATQIREMLSAGTSAAEYLPEKVDNLLATYRPYSYTKVIDSIDEDSWQKLNAYERRLFSYLGRERRLHTVSTCLLALQLAAVHNVPALAAGTAALLHDLAKELPDAELDAYSGRYLGREEASPALRHGPAAAYLAREQFAITSEDVLNAIQYHTTGRPGMSSLEKIIFLADKIEYGRPFRDLDLIRKLAFAEGLAACDKELSLDRALCRCYEEVFAALDRSGHEICPLSKDAYNILK